MLYVEIAKDLTRKILNNEYTELNKLPSEMDLADQYDTSKMTIRKALQMLIDSGIIFSIPKSGYYINSYEYIKKFNSLTGNSFTFLNAGEKTKSKVIYFKKIKANEVLKNKFRTELDEVYEVKRIRYLKGKLKALEHVYLRADMFPDFNEEICKDSIYEYVKQSNYTIATNIKTLRAGFAPDEYVEYEPQLKRIPLIEIENIGFLTNGQIFEYSISFNIDHAYSTVIKFNNILKED